MGDGGLNFIITDGAGQLLGYWSRCGLRHIKYKTKFVGREVGSGNGIRPVCKSFPECHRMVSKGVSSQGTFGLHGGRVAIRANHTDIINDFQAAVTPLGGFD